MNSLIGFSKHLAISVAFVGLMAGAGGFVGAVGGVILGLLGHTVLGMASSMLMFMPAGIAVGAVTALILGLFLMRQPEPHLAWHTRVTPGATEKQ